jgi:hypothetical protein
MQRPSRRARLTNLGATSLFLFCLTTPAHAEVYKCGTYHASSLFDGYSDASNDPDYWEGVSASIVVRSGSVCDTDTSGNNVSVAWTMVASNAGKGGYAQSGYYRYYGSPLYHFAQYRQTATSKYVTKFSTNTIAAGGTYRYWQQSVYNSAAAQWQIRDNYNTTIILQTNFNTFSAWTLPLSVQFEGETKYAESDIPGTTSAKAHFSSMQVQRFSDNGFQAGLPALYGPAAGQTSTRYKRSAVAGNAFDIWTG